MSKKTVGFALCGSFCTFRRVIPEISVLRDAGFTVVPIMSFQAYGTDTRFGKAEDFRLEIEAAAGNGIIATIPAAEPIGPKRLLDALIIAPCTGNTLAKLAVGIADTPVTMAAKSHLRNGRPVVLAVSSNDALGQNARNIGQLMAAKHFFFAPLRQDDAAEKPNSIVADFERLPETLALALEGRQIQPVIGR